MSGEGGREVAGSGWAAVAAGLSHLPEHERDEVMEWIAESEGSGWGFGDVRAAVGWLTEREPDPVSHRELVAWWREHGASQPDPTDNPDPTGNGLDPGRGARLGVDLEGLLGIGPDIPVEVAARRVSGALTGAPDPRLAEVLAGLITTRVGAEARHPVHEQYGHVLDPCLSDSDVVGYTVAAEAIVRWGQWLRGQGIRELQTRWTTTDPRRTPDHDDDDDADAEGEGEGEGRTRRRRLIRAGRSHERWEQRRTPDHPDPDVDELDLEDGADDSADGGPLTATRRRLSVEERTSRSVLARAFAVTEIALATGVSESVAREWASIGDGLDGLPLTEAGLRTGGLDWAKARVIVQALTGRTPTVAEAVEGLVVPDALTGPGQKLRSLPALRERLASALLLVDPDLDDGPRERGTRSVRTRKLSAHLGQLTATMPLEDLTLIAAQLDAAVADARTRRDPRTADQVRLDTLLDLLHTRCNQPDHQPDQQDGESQAGEPQAGESQAGEEPGTTGSSSRGCRGGGSSARVQILLVMTLETLLGLRDDPAMLDQYGPVPAALARELAENGTFRCAAIDDTHATLLGLGRTSHQTRYVPGTRLTDLLRTTYRRCSFPGCRTRALAPTGSADLDHVDPWPHGPTCDCNLTALCRTHHRMKTHGKITLEPAGPHEPPGSWHWHLPTGRTYTGRPTPLVDTLHEPDNPPPPPF